MEMDRGCAMRAGLSAASLTLALATGCASSGAPSVAPFAATSGGPSAASTFVAEYEYGSGDTGGGHGAFLSLFDERSGQHLRDLAHFDENAQLRLAGFSRAADGSVFYAAARGPYYRSNVSGGDPRPGSCGGTVRELQASTGRGKSLFEVGKDWTVQGPVVSPDGRSVAYLSQPCTEMFAARVVVHELASGTERQVWVSGTSATSVSWRGDGRQVVFTVDYPNQHSRAEVPSYAVVSSRADGAQPSSAVRRAPDPGCVVERAVYSRSALDLVEGCPDVVTAPARLVQLVDDGPTVAWRRSTGLCPNGMTAADDTEGRLLVTSTTRCGDAGVPVDVVQVWNGQHSREVNRYVNPQQFVSAGA